MNRKHTRIVGRDVIDEFNGSGTFDKNLAHVAHIEETTCGSNSSVLGEYARVLDGKFPAAKIYHPAIEFFVLFKQSGPL